MIHLSSWIISGESERKALKIGALPTENLPQKSHDRIINPRSPPKHRSPPPILERVKYYDLQDLKDRMSQELGDWTVHENNPECLMLRKQLSSSWTIYVCVFSSLKAKVFVDGYTLPSNHDIYSSFGHSADVELSKVSLRSLLQEVSKYVVCKGIDFKPNIRIPAACFSHASNPTLNMIQGHSFTQIWCLRSKKCKGLIDSIICNECESIKSSISSTNHLKLNTPLTLATHDQLVTALKSTRRRLNNRDKTIKNLLQPFQTRVEVDDKLSLSPERKIYL